jgi:hypothetical protein
MDKHESGLNAKSTSSWRAPLKISLVILVVWMSLFLFAFIVGWSFSCNVNEGGTSPCLVGGVDIQALILVPALLGAFGAPFFLLGIGGGVFVAIVLFIVDAIRTR